MRALLDVNVLIALMDSAHVHHLRAWDWLGDNIANGWSSCPLTQNGCIRIMSQPSYPNSRPPGEIARRLRDAVMSPEHQFWPDDLSLLEKSIFNWDQLYQPRHLTDAYLLAMAVGRNGVFVTFDHAVPLEAVSGADSGHLIRL